MKQPRVRHYGVWATMPEETRAAINAFFAGKKDFWSQYQFIRYEALGDDERDSWLASIAPLLVVQRDRDDLDNLRRLLGASIEQRIAA